MRVRVTDMRGVDLVRTSFDFDLTFAALLMRPDGHVYHRYGSRDERGASVWLSLSSWESLLDRTLREHGAHLAQPKALGEPAAGRPGEPLALEALPAFAKRDKGACIHCHSVFPALYEEARAAGSWSEDQRWVYPPPGRIGLDLDRDDQTLVVAVAPNSVAARADIRVGDRLRSAAGQELATASDLSQVLHDAPAAAGEIALSFERGGERLGQALQLPAGWKRGTPLEFSWRPFKWGMTPAPGFGGTLLDAREKRALALRADAFAFRVTYLVTWGDNRRYGEQAARAGLREGDLFLSAAGKDDFASSYHFHAWWRLTRVPGESVALEVLRDGERLQLDLEVLP